jgi:hypothetical protein
MVDLRAEVFSAGMWNRKIAARNHDLDVGGCSPFGDSIVSGQSQMFPSLRPCVSVKAGNDALLHGAGRRTLSAHDQYDTTTQQ